MLTTIINWNFVSIDCGKHSHCQSQGSEEHRDLKYSEKNSNIVGYSPYTVVTVLTQRLRFLWEEGTYLYSMLSLKGRVSQDSLYVLGESALLCLCLIRQLSLCKKEICGRPFIWINFRNERKVTVVLTQIMEIKCRNQELSAVLKTGTRSSGQCSFKQKMQKQLCQLWFLQEQRLMTKPGMGDD